MHKKSSLLKKPIKKVAVVYRPGRKASSKLASEVSQWLMERKIKVYSHPKRKFKVNSKFIPICNKPKELDLIVVLGGDGTYLEAVRMLEGTKVPILGVNMGSLGFLTENRIENLYPALEMTLNGKMEACPRSMLKVRVKNGKTSKEFLALNDVVIERGARSHLIDLEVFSEKNFVCNVKSDGLIISSPTGSTAYNLAAGGPILHPEVDAVVVTPICPHSLTNRPLIFPDDRQLCFQLKPGKQTASLTIDGLSCGDINDKKHVSIERAKQDHYVLKKPSHNYFTLLTEKLRFGERD